MVLAADKGRTRLDDGRAEIYTEDSFLSAQEQAIVQQIMRPLYRPAAAADEGGYTRSGHYLGQTAELGKVAGAYPLLEQIESRLAALVGLPPDHGEDTLGHRYPAGQFHRVFQVPNEVSLADYRGVILPGMFTPADAPRSMRVWRLLVFTTADPRVDRLRFPLLGLDLPGQSGQAVWWRCHLPNGFANGLVAQDMIITRGIVVLSKWFRDAPVAAGADNAIEDGHE